MNKIIKKLFVPLLATIFLTGAGVTLSACNTIEGAGQDIQAGGKAIKDEANEHKN
ncbi:MAG: entericidin A/B family lipoprotein [Rugosibacter sp.]|nr:MAG: entericidin A/B family lipoprotein [Rugosibacter sp.]TBR10945.1 MAG: entericidin A/B family lipoprotein [Rugosibacter sp.]